MNKEEIVLIESAMNMVPSEEQEEMRADAYDAAYKDVQREDPELGLILQDVSDKLRYVGPVSCRDLLVKLYAFLEKNDAVEALRDKPWGMH